jgi:hypothetical protein
MTSPTRSSFLFPPVALAAAAVLIVGAPSCGPSTPQADPPQILSIQIEDTNVTTGLTISMAVEAVGTGNLTYLWEASRDDGQDDIGFFTEPQSDLTSWTAPFDPGPLLISVTVSDLRGSTTRSIPVLVGSGIDGDGDGFSVADGDCDDTDDTVYPGAPELIDAIDNDCDGQTDEGADDVDDDGDGFTDLQGDCNDNDETIYPGAEEIINGVDDNCNGDIDDGTSAFDDDGDGFSEDEGDCDDTNSSIGPAANELLDGVDNDCDGVIDENTVGYDDDGDGYTELQGDCDDGDTDTWPGAPELPDGEDNDCNGQIDDGSFILDDDGDGYTDLAGDCDDTNPYTYPGAPEYADGQDNDCDGEIDELAGMDNTDNDGDGFSEADGDCNDLDAAIYPGALELDDGIDNDCDGLGYTNPPLAIGSITSDTESCLPVQVSGANSYDPDGDTLDFTWFFTTRPPLSQLIDDDIIDRYAMDASFVPDAAGYWALALQVTDGAFTSAPATVGFTVSPRDGNTTPIAAFVGSNINVTDTTTCSTDSYGVCSSCTPCEPVLTIDATASTDPDGDVLTYIWSASKVSGDGQPPVINNNGNGTADLSLNLSVGCGSISSGLFAVEVQVHDCNGALDTATFQVNYNCQSS